MSKNYYGFIVRRIEDHGTCVQAACGPCHFPLVSAGLVAGHGSENRGSLVNARSVRLSRNVTRSRRSSSVTVKVISNLTYQVERARAGLGYATESWAAWARRREATPLPGAAAFMARVRALGGKIAIVTNRLGSECDDTIAVFTRDTLVYDAMLCRPNGRPSDKNTRFDAVRGGTAPGIATPVEVIAFVGDNIQDFPPMYGSWQ